MPINAQFQQTPDWLKPQGLNGFQEGLKAGSDVIQLQQDIQQNALVAKAREQQIQMTGLKMAQETLDRDLMIKAEANSMELQQSIASHLERGDVSMAQQAYVGMIAKYPYLLNSQRNKALGGALKVAEDADRERQKIEDNRLFRRDQIRSHELIAEQNNLTRQQIAYDRAANKDSSNFESGIDVWEVKDPTTGKGLGMYAVQPKGSKTAQLIDANKLSQTELIDYRELTGELRDVEKAITAEPIDPSGNFSDKKVELLNRRIQLKRRLAKLAASESGAKHINPQSSSEAPLAPAVPGVLSWEKFQNSPFKK